MREMGEKQVWSLGCEDPLEEGMATLSSILAMDKGGWQATVHGASNSQIQQSTHTYFTSVPFLNIPTKLIKSDWSPNRQSFKDKAWHAGDE